MFESETSASLDLIPLWITKPGLLQEKRGQLTLEYVALDDFNLEYTAAHFEQKVTLIEHIKSLRSILVSKYGITYARNHI